MSHQLAGAVAGLDVTQHVLLQGVQWLIAAAAAASGYCSAFLHPLVFVLLRFLWDCTAPNSDKVCYALITCWVSLIL
jgi:hypothetical protein